MKRRFAVIWFVLLMRTISLSCAVGILFLAIEADSKQNWGFNVIERLCRQAKCQRRGWNRIAGPALPIDIGKLRILEENEVGDGWTRWRSAGLGAQRPGMEWKPIKSPNLISRVQIYRSQQHVTARLQECTFGLCFKIYKFALRKNKRFERRNDVKLQDLSLRPNLCLRGVQIYREIENFSSYLPLPSPSLRKSSCNSIWTQSSSK